MDNLIFVGLVLAGVALFGASLWFIRKFNITKNDAQFGDKVARLLIYLYRDADVDIKNKEQINKALDIVEDAVEMFVGVYAVENLHDSKDLVFAFAKQLAEKNGVEMDSEFVELLVDVIDFYVEEMYTEKGLVD